MLSIVLSMPLLVEGLMVLVSHNPPPPHLTSSSPRNTLDRQGSRLKVLETENSSLKDQVTLMNESLSIISLEREGLRAMNEKSSADLRKALEVWSPHPLNNN